jgi:hypothetical protein
MTASKCITDLNYWVMHPVARVSNTLKQVSNNNNHKKLNKINFVNKHYILKLLNFLQRQSIYTQQEVDKSEYQNSSAAYRHEQQRTI